MDHIQWSIPGGDEAQEFGPVQGYDEAWAALRRALLAGWVVAIETKASQAAVARELARMAKLEGRTTHLKPSKHGIALSAWWS